MQHFGDIDIAQSGDRALIEQERFEIRLATVREDSEMLRREVAIQRLDADVGEQRVRINLGCGDQQHEPESARVVVGDGGAAAQIKRDVVVLGIVAGLVHVVADRRGMTSDRRRDCKTPAHAQMHDERVTALDRRHQILGAPAEVDHPPTFEPRGKIRRKRKSQVLASLLKPGDAHAFHDWSQPTPDGFDFGEFGHRMVQAFRRETLLWRWNLSHTWLTSPRPVMRLSAECQR